MKDRKKSLVRTQKKCKSKNHSSFLTENKDNIGVVP